MMDDAETKEKKMDESNGAEERVEGKVAEQLYLREISKKRLKEILKAHWKWLESRGKEGEPADLWRANLREPNLEEANLP